MTYCGPYSQSYNFTHMFDIKDRRGPYPKKAACPNDSKPVYPNNKLNALANSAKHKICIKIVG